MLQLVGRTVAIDCLACGRGFEIVKSGPGRLPRFCSEACKVLRGHRRIQPVACATCGTLYLPTYGPTAGYCSIACRRYPERKIYDSQDDRRHAKRSRRRCRAASVEYEDFTKLEIFERDNWRCHICGGAVDPLAKLPDMYSASLDHIKPIAKGGAHTKSNVKCAHFICNARKTDTWAESTG